MEGFFIERITDITNDLCKHVDSLENVSSPSLHQQLTSLYDYHRANGHIHPLTNWHAHRIRCMSAIASKLQDRLKVWQCHGMVMEYFLKSCSCSCHCEDVVMKNRGRNHDYMHRNSLNYVVYGSQALVNACLYLKPFTKYDYVFLFDPVRRFLQPYLDGEKKHMEFVHSELSEDKQKKEYKKQWEPAYAKTFLRLLDELSSSSS